MTELESELGREVSADEQALAREVLVRMRSTPYEQIRLAVASQQAGLRKQRSVQIAATWENDGLISRSAHDQNVIRVTNYGEKILPRIRDGGGDD